MPLYRVVVSVNADEEYVIDAASEREARQEASANLLEEHGDLDVIADVERIEPPADAPAAEDLTPPPGGLRVLADLFDGAGRKAAAEAARTAAALSQRLRARQIDGDPIDLSRTRDMHDLETALVEVEIEAEALFPTPERPRRRAGFAPWRAVEVPLWAAP